MNYLEARLGGGIVSSQDMFKASTAEELEELEVYKTSYENVRAESIEPLHSDYIGTFVRRMDEVDMYTLALVSYFSSVQSGRNGLTAVTLREIIKQKKLLYGERLISIALGRLEFVGAIESKLLHRKMRVYNIRYNGSKMDLLLSSINEQYINFTGKIMSDFEADTINND